MKAKYLWIINLLSSFIYTHADYVSLKYALNNKNGSAGPVVNFVSS